MPKAMLGTPRRTVLAGIAALVVATILLLAYLSHYRSSIKSQNANVPVWTVGKTGGDTLTLAGERPILVSILRERFESWLPAYMAGEL